MLTNKNVFNAFDVESHLPCTKEIDVQRPTVEDESFLRRSHLVESVRSRVEKMRLFGKVYLVDHCRWSHAIIT